MAELPIEKMLVLSTAHLTDTTCNETIREFAYDKEGYGWFIYVGPPNPNHPDDLTACLNFAREHGVPWIMFDADGTELEELPTYEW